MIEVDRHILDRFEGEIVLLALEYQRAQILFFPVSFAREIRRVHLHALHSDLRGEAQFFVGKLIELANCDPDACFRHVLSPAVLNAPVVAQDAPVRNRHHVRPHSTQVR